MIVFDTEAPSSLATLSGFDALFRNGQSPPVAIFDFDGVLCASTEDMVYKLPERPGERERLTELGHEYGILGDIYDVPYLRHLLLQAMLVRQDTIPAAGPMLPLAKEMCLAGRPFFVLTARSGRAAIDRALAFMTHHELIPQEIFFVGRVAKGRQLTLLRQTIPLPAPLIYFDDSPRHSRNSHAQLIKELVTVHVDTSNDGHAAAEKLLAETIGSTTLRHYARSAA